MSTFFRVQLPYEKWYGLIGNESFMASNPFYLSTDGLLLIVKDRTLTERGLTDEEKKEFRYAEYETAIFATTSGGKRGYVPKEKAIKINVKKKQKKSPLEDGFEILMPEDKPKENEKDTEMPDDTLKSIDNVTNDTADTALTNGDAKISKPEVTTNGNHCNGNSHDVPMAEES